jgi:uncharacterized protein YecE (DUF72 family)
VTKFFSKIKLSNHRHKAVIEFRDPSWWKAIDKIEDMGLVFCSVDAPGLPRDRIVTNKTIYLRILVIRNGIDMSPIKQYILEYWL